MHMRLLLIGLLLTSPVLARAQEGLTEAAFDAATIKRNVSGGDGWALNPRPTGQFGATNARPIDLLQAAFLIQPYQLEGDLPDWTRNERYDIVAKLDAALAKRDQPPGFAPTWSLALRAFLIDQLQLKFHRQTVQRPVYALVRAREGALGPKIKPTAFDCEALRQQAVAAARSGGPSPYPPTTDTQIACGMRATAGRIVYGGSALAEFRAALSRLVGRAVLDQTGMDGRWDFVLTYATEAQLRSGEPTDSPDLFTALTEQLGLKLQSTNGPVEMLIVDRIERPRSN
jgi:uncharacterized protein (TIGR03435 family)